MLSHDLNPKPSVLNNRPLQRRLEQPQPMTVCIHLLIEIYVTYFLLADQPRPASDRLRTCNTAN